VGTHLFNHLYDRISPTYEYDKFTGSVTNDISISCNATVMLPRPTTSPPCNMLMNGAQAHWRHKLAVKNLRISMKFLRNATIINHYVNILLQTHSFPAQTAYLYCFFIFILFLSEL
jgi:hypothetical protein